MVKDAEAGQFRREHCACRNSWGHASLLAQLQHGFLDLGKMKVEAGSSTNGPTISLSSPWTWPFPPSS